MASMKEIWAEAKEGVKKENVKFADGMRKNAERTKAESKRAARTYKRETAGIEKPKWEKPNRSFNKTVMMVWLLVLLIPLGVFGLFLLWTGGLLIWDAIFGL